MTVHYPEFTDGRLAGVVILRKTDSLLEFGRHVHGEYVILYQWANFQHERVAETIHWSSKSLLNEGTVSIVLIIRPQV